jgi:hypothetical protein
MMYVKPDRRLTPLLRTVLCVVAMTLNGAGAAA